jgi:Ras-related protein Rab-37
LFCFSKAGQERFRSVTHSYYRDANALLLLYDVTSYSSFENVSAWLSEIKEFAHDGVIIMLIGNKIDKSQRVVSREAGERLARDYEVSFLETSAKTGQNVELAFMATAQALLDNELTRKNAHNGHFTLNDMVKMPGMSSLNNNRDNYNNTTNGARANGWCC